VSLKIWMILPFVSPTELPALALAAEAAGVTGVGIGDHACIPAAVTSSYPYADIAFSVPARIPFPDPMVVAAALGAVTTTLRFTTSVLLLPLRDPILLAKQVATASALTGGRVELGGGVGWMREEYDAMSVPFQRRGSRMDEMLTILRRLWTGDFVEHHGEHFSFAPVAVNPAPAGYVPIHIGGHSDAAFRRAARLGDGWVGVDPTVDELASIMPRLETARRQADALGRPFEIRTGVNTAGRPFDARMVRTLARLGVTSITVQPAQLLPPGTPHYEITAAAIAEAMPVFVDLVRNTQ
jgi:probable F420-dependent oxidoreductase